ncbi:hypothetical protein GGS21DRAFT_547702 [Xylaria nigripes]|nr:hypothetical protein GGS21DRAFT_547702 [Xylaria nigripes]
MTSNLDWGERTSALSVATEYADRIKGRNIIITGVGPEGIGEGTAMAIASQEPANLILMSRNERGVEASAKKIRTSYYGVNVRVVIMDLASQESIRAAAAEVKRLVSSLDLLVNNAGCSSYLRRWTAEGIEMQFGVNHVGAFLLTKLLFPLMKAAAKNSPPGTTRIINLSSHGHRLSPIRFHDYNMENKELPPEERHTVPVPPAFVKASPDGYFPIIAYGQSKTANILFTQYLQDRASAYGIMSYVIHPGAVKTNLGREHDDDINKALIATSKYWKNIDEGSATTLVAALDPSLDESRGLYLADCQFARCADHAQDRDVADRLWKLSEELTGGIFTL